MLLRSAKKKSGKWSCNVLLMWVLPWPLGEEPLSLARCQWPPAIRHKEGFFQRGH